MSIRSMYVWKLDVALKADGGVAGMLDRAERAKFTQIWIKLADRANAFDNTTGSTGEQLKALVTGAHERGIGIWGWHVPHCADDAAAYTEAKAFGDLARDFGVDGLIMDAEAEQTFFAGELQQAGTYADAMREVANALGKPLAISSNDQPDNFTGWRPKFMRIAQVADLNFPQTYYGANHSVQERVDQAARANAGLTIPFIPVGAAFLGVQDGGCPTSAACAENARTFIELCNERGYQGCGFWEWNEAPSALWATLNTIAP